VRRDCHSRRAPGLRKGVRALATIATAEVVEIDQDAGSLQFFSSNINRRYWRRIIAHSKKITGCVHGYATILGARRVEGVKHRVGELSA